MSSDTAGPALPASATRPTEAERMKMIEGVDRMIHRTIRDFGFRPADAEDVAQDVRLRLWEVSAAFDPAGPAKWSTFAGSVIKNVLKDRRDHIVREAMPGGKATAEIDDKTTPDRRTLVEPGDDEDDDEQAGTLVTAVRRQLAGPALAALTPGTRRIVEAVVFGGLTIDQYAEQTGQPVKVVRTNLTLALGQLALAGHVPTDMAARLGLDARELTERADPAAARQKRAARRELVAEALALGQTVTEIAAGLGETLSSVSRDVEAMRRPPKPTPRRKRVPRGTVGPRVRDGIGRGLSPADIAAEVGCVVETLRSYMRQFQAEPAAPAAAV